MASSHEYSSFVEDNSKRYIPERNVNVLGTVVTRRQLICMIFSCIILLVGLIFFISAIVIYNKRPSTSTSSDISSAQPHKQSGDDDITAKNTPSPISTPNTSQNKWSVTTVNGKPVRPGELVFRDEFNSLDTKTWFHYSGIAAGSQFFFNVNNRSNSFVKDGILYLKPTYTHEKFGKAYVENGTLLLGLIPSDRCTNATTSSLCWKGQSSIVHPIMAPMIMTTGTFAFKYGKLQIRAKMPAGDWIEPIITVLPEEDFYGKGYLSGQIHMVDTRGNRKLFNKFGSNVGSEQNCPDIRYGTDESKKLVFDCVSTQENEGFDKDFHIYELEWTPSMLTIKIDNEGVVSAPFPHTSMYKLWSKGLLTLSNPWRAAENPIMAPFDQSFSIAMAISVGGASFSDDEVNVAYPKPWKNTDPDAPEAFWNARDLWEPTWDDHKSAMQIDYIRLFALNETLAEEPQPIYG